MSAMLFNLVTAIHATFLWLHVTPSQLFQHASQPPSLICDLKYSNAHRQPHDNDHLDGDR